MEPREHRRRLDRVTDVDYLADLANKSTAQLRAMRDDCREEEPGLSFARRVVHGQLDIVRAEQHRRAGGDDGGLVGSLSDILADEPAPHARQARSSPLYTPDVADYGNRTWDVPVDDPALGRVPDLDDGELAAFADRLVASEREVSRLRRTVLDHLDALQAELIRRYRDGDVDVDEALAAAFRVDAPRDGD